MVELKNVCKFYNTKNGERSELALDGVNASFQSGQISVIYGCDGSGKTTLLNILAGFEKPNSGEFLLEGKSTSKYSSAKWSNIRATDISFVTQEPYLISHENVLSNVLSSLTFKRIAGVSNKKLAKDALETVGLKGFEKTKIENLTMFQKQLVSIARALAKDAKIILADEPTSCLKEKQAKQVLDILKNAATKKVVILATHSEKVADYVQGARFNINEGKLSAVASATPAAVTAAAVTNVKTTPTLATTADAAAVTAVSAKAPAKTITNVSAKAASAASAASVKSVPAAIVASAKTATDQAATTKQNPKQEQKPKKPSVLSMGFVKGFSFALSNAKEHKLRTCLTILAMSIGVIGICTVLALCTGLSAYVDHVEETTLSTTPITISKYKFSTQTTKAQEEQAQVTAAETQEKETKRAQYLKEASENRRIALNNTIATFLSSNGNQNTEGTSLLNDVPALKTYLDTNPDNINNVASSIEYTYDTSPVIYSTANNTVEEVYPGGLFGSIGTGSSSTKGAKASMTSSAYSVENYMSDFKVLPASTSVYEDSDSLVEGKWAQNSDEAVLVLNSDGTMDDSLAYTLGLKDFSSEIEPLIEKYKNGEKVDYPGIYDSWAYSDVIGITFKVITPADVYQKKSDGTWEDKSTDDNFMNNLDKNKARDLKIVGVIIPTDGSRASATLNSGIYYAPSLNTEMMQAAATSEIVRDQLDNPDTDVLSGKTFSWLKQASTVADRVDFSNIVNINTDMLASCVTLHPEVLDWDDKGTEVEEEVKLSDEEIERMTYELLSDKEFQEFIVDLASSPNFDASVQSALATAGAAYAQYCAEMLLYGETAQEAEVWFSENGDGYTYTLLVQSLLPESLEEDISQFVGKYAKRVSNYISATVETEINNMIVDLQNELNSEANDDGPSLIEFDEQKFQNSIKINITEDDIAQLGAYLVGSTSHTYASNLSDFGYATTDTPITCTIYPKSFDDKEKITAVLDKYNAEKRAQDKESEAISYTDTVGSIVSIIENAIKIVGGILVALLIYSLISVIILIAIIIAISTFQRAREVGVLRAIGATKRDIFVLFDSEAMLFGFLSSIFSVAVSALICCAINAATQKSSIAFSIAQLNPQIVIGAIVICSIVASLAGAIPSLFAARRK